MTRPPRVSRLVLAAAAAAGLSAPARGAEPDKLIPASADTVAVVNLRQIIDSEIVKKFALDQIKQFLDGQDAKQLLTDLGLDPLKDVDKLVIATSDTSKTDTKFLMVARGRFDPDKLAKTAEAQARKDGERFAVVKDGDFVMYKFQPPDGQPPVYFAPADDKAVVAASEQKMVAAAVRASAAGAKPAVLKKELADLVRKADEKASVYAVSVLKGKLDDVKVPGGGMLPVKLDDFEKVLPKVETMSVAVKIGADVVVDVTLGMADDDAAGDMRNALDDLFKQLKPLVQLLGAADARGKPLADILAGIKTGSKNKDVTISGKITGADIGKMLNPGD
ncbi:MAG: hypothetical protein C0501_29445 [Isosphaera sp.]|nr:hypothetical protein [Isosphaera sp.]